MWDGLCTELQPTKRLLGFQQKGAPQAEKRERKKAPSRTVSGVKTPGLEVLFDTDHGA